MHSNYRQVLVKIHSLLARRWIRMHSLHLLARLWIRMHSLQPLARRWIRIHSLQPLAPRWIRMHSLHLLDQRWIRIRIPTKWLFLARKASLMPGAKVLSLFSNQTKLNNLSNLNQFSANKMPLVRPCLKITRWDHKTTHKLLVNSSRWILTNRQARSFSRKIWQVVLRKDNSLCKEAMQVVALCSTSHSYRRLSRSLNATELYWPTQNSSSDRTTEQDR